MPIPTEPIGSVPRPRVLQEAMRDFAEGSISSEKMDRLFDEAVRETIEQFEATGSPVITDGEHLKSNQRIYVGVIDVINEDVESVETVRDRVLTATEYIPVAQIGTTDDCGFSPFSDDIVTARSIAFAKIKARVRGTKMAAAQLGV